MTKLALGLTLAGVFVAGYKLGGATEVPQGVPREVQRKKSPVARTQPSKLLSGGPSRSIASAAQAAPVSEDLQIAQAVRGETTLPMDSLARFYYKKEREFRAQMIDSQLTIRTHSEATRNGEPQASTALEMQLREQAAVSMWWKGDVEFTVDGNAIAFHLLIDFRDLSEGEDGVCWNVRSFSAAFDRVSGLSWDGRCVGFAVLHNGIPSTEVSTYATPNLGGVVSSVIFPVSVSASESQTQYLDAKTMQWVSGGNIVFRAMSKDEYEADFQTWNGKVTFEPEP